MSEAITEEALRQDLLDTARGLLEKQRFEQLLQVLKAYACVRPLEQRPPLPPGSEIPGGIPRSTPP